MLTMRMLNIFRIGSNGPEVLGGLSRAIYDPHKQFHSAMRIGNYGSRTDWQLQLGRDCARRQEVKYKE